VALLDSISLSETNYVDDDEVTPKLKILKRQLTMLDLYSETPEQYDRKSIRNSEMDEFICG
jgi:hypothetical protein